MGSQHTASKESRYPIFVASEQRLDVNREANIQPAATKVTNIGYRLSLEASPLPAANQEFTKSSWSICSCPKLHSPRLYRTLVHGR